MSDLKLFEFKNKYKLPEKYKGKIKKNGGLTLNDPREWTLEEIEWTNMLQEKGFTIKQIAKCLDRELVSVQIKIKRLKKETGKTYNEKHRQDKYNTNNMFLDKFNVKSILDVFAGEKSFYKNKCDTLVTNDKEKNYRCNYNMDSFKLLCKLHSENKSFDLIDLDPFGSAYDCFDIAIKMSKKAIIITFGELGHLRWKRLDFVKQRYNINNLEDFKIEKMIEKVIKIGKRNKKKLNPIFIKKWTNIGRVYFKVD